MEIFLLRRFCHLSASISQPATSLPTLFTPQGSHPIHKVTIIPRGQSLGHTAFVPATESNQTKAQLKALLDVAMGGRIGEQLLDDERKINKGVTTGASSDFNVSERAAYWVVSKKRLETHIPKGFWTLVGSGPEGDDVLQHRGVNFPYVRANERPSGWSPEGPAPPGPQPLSPLQAPAPQALRPSPGPSSLVPDLQPPPLPPRPAPVSP